MRVLAQAYLVSSFPFWKGETMANFRIPSAVPLLEVREGREREREEREIERELAVGRCARSQKGEMLAFVFGLSW